jgi:hypothetical protein
MVFGAWGLAVALPAIEAELGRRFPRKPRVAIATAAPGRTRGGDKPGERTTNPAFLFWLCLWGNCSKGRSRTQML